MPRLLLSVILVAALVPLAACQRTVSPEGYVSETPFEAYQRKIPTGYGGHRPVVLKPPVAAAPLVVETPRYDVPPVAAPVVSAPVAPVYTTQPLAPPAPVTASPRSSVEWHDLSSYDGTLPAVPVTQTAPAQAYTSPVLDNLMGSQIARPSGLLTREVDYGREISIYPLERADAPLPYIPPASAVQQAPVKAMKKQSAKTTQATGYNQ